MSLNGGKIAGGNPKNKRVENDFYATNPKAVEMLFEKEEFYGDFLEPCVGQGHIAKSIQVKYPKAHIECCDIVDRGYPNTLVCDFIEHDFLNQKFNSIITNPPYSLAKEFLEKGMEVLENNGKIAMFLKIQFLEGEKRREMFQKYPPKYIYVFTKRMATFNNGQELDDNGKKWATTMCHAWFIWEKGFMGEPVVRWL